MPKGSTQPSIDDLVRTHADMVYRLAMLHMKQKYDAEDVFQEVFLRLAKNIDSLTTEEHIKAWLIRVTINCCKTQLTGSWKKKVVVMDQSVLEQKTESDTEPEKDGEEVWDAVKTLPEIYRNVIHLFYFEDFPISRIAEVMKIREGTVKSQLSRGRKLLKDILEGGAMNE